MTSESYTFHINSPNEFYKEWPKRCTRFLKSIGNTIRGNGRGSFGHRNWPRKWCFESVGSLESCQNVDIWGTQKRTAPGPINICAYCIYSICIYLHKTYFPWWMLNLSLAFCDFLCIRSFSSLQIAGWARYRKRWPCKACGVGSAPWGTWP